MRTSSRGTDRWRGLVAVAVLLAAGCRPDQPAPEAAGPGIRGLVQAQDGEPVGGAFVVASLEESTVSYTTVSDPEGRFSLPVPPRGIYGVRAKRSAADSAGTGVVSELAHEGATSEVTVVTGSESPAWDRAPARAFLASLPEGAEKRRFILDCTGCHQFDQTIVAVEDRLKSEEEWLTWTTQMIETNANMSPSREAPETASWLAQHVGGASSSVEKVAPVWDPIPVDRDVSRALVTEYELPVPQDLPHDVKVDIDGRLLITGQLTGLMYLLDPETGEVTWEEVPTELANPRAIDIDAEGNWFVALGVPESVARKDRATGEWDIRHVDMHPHSIQLDDEGAIWYNGHFSIEPERIGRVDFHEVDPEQIVVPSEPMPDGGITMQYGLRLAPDGTVWTTQLMGNRLVRYDPVAGDFTLYPMPEEASGPRRPDISADGRVWIPEFANNRLTVFEPEDEQFEHYPMPFPDMLPYVVRVDRTRNLVWIGTAAADALIRFDPVHERFTVFPLPTKGALIRHLDIDERNGDVWGAYGHFPSRGRNRVVRLRAH